MFVCVECGNVFDEPKKYEGDLLEHFGTPCKEIFTGCPNCLGAYVATKNCDVCGEPITTDTYYKINKYNVCENCCEEHNLSEGDIL